MMEVLWKASNRSVVVLLLFGLCNGLPINLENSGPDPRTQFLTGLVAVLLTICSVVLLAGCLCCQRKNGFKEFRDSPVVSSAAIVSTNQDHGHVNPIANSSSEFTIFTPISPPHHNNNVFLANQRIVSCSQEEYKDGDIDASSWFDGSEKDFPRTKLKYIRELGKGWFGRVVEGTAQNISEDPSDPEWTPVIVRILESSATSREKLLFLNDVAIYKCGYHPNILRILGRSLDTAPLLLLQEYCPQGDLKKYLRMCKSSQDKLVAEDMPLRWCYQLTLALKFLHEQKLTHPDLAARNCQLSDDLSLKLGDYGLSAAYYPEDYYQGSPGVPLRWCAPEIISYTSTTIQTTPITTESNVWALGVAMWEILEWGEQPYLGLTDDEVISQVLGTPKVRLTRPTYHLIYTEYMYKIMQSCWYNAESRVTVSQIELMMTDLMHVYENTKMSLDLNSDIPHEGEPISLEDFDSRWNALKPNSPTEQETNALEPNQNHQQKQDRSQKSASLNNLHGSLDNLLDTRQFDPMESWLENVASDTSDMSFVRGLSEAITDLDNAIAMQNLNSSPEFGLKSSKNASGPQFTSSESETEDENWRRKIERGAYTEKVRQKSRSVADLMVLTHIDCSESDSETLPSLDYKVNQRVRYLKSVENQKKFGSEGNLFQAQDNTFREELKKLQEERRDSLLFVPDKFSECSFSEEGGAVTSAIAPTSLSNNRLDSLENSPVKMLMEKLNSPSEMVPPQQVYNVFNVRVRHMKVGSTVCDKVGEADAINNDIAANVICDRLESKVLEQNVLVPDSPANQNSSLNINQNAGRESPNHIKTIFSPIEDVRIKSVDGGNVTFSKIRDLNIETYPSLKDVKSTNLGFDKIEKVNPTEPIATKENNFEVKIEILNEQNSPSTIQKNYDHLSNEISPKEIFVTSKENSKNIKLKVPKLSEIIQRNAIDYKVHHHHSVGGGNDKSSVISKSEENEKLVHQEIVDKDSGLNTPENSASLEKLYDDNEEILDIGSFDSDRSNETNNKGVLLTDISNEDEASVKEKREIDSKEEISEMIDFCIKKETRLICDLFLTHERSACFADLDEKFDKINIGDIAKKYSYLNYDYRRDMQNFIEAEVYHSSNLIKHSVLLNDLENDFNTKSSESVYNKENREVLNLSRVNLPNVSIPDTKPLAKDIVNINDEGNFTTLGGIPDNVISLPREDQNKLRITTPLIESCKDEILKEAHLINTDIIKIISDRNLTQLENELRGNLVLETKFATEDLNDKVNLEDGLRNVKTIDCENSMTFNNRLNSLSDLSTSANSDKFGDDQVKDQISLDNNLMPNLSDKEHISIMFESEFAKNNYDEEDSNDNRDEICLVQVESNEGDDDMLPEALIRQRTTLFLTNEVINYDDSHRNKNEVGKETQNAESSKFSQVNTTTTEQTLMFLNNEIENYEISNFYHENLADKLNKIENKFENEGISETLQEGSNFPNNENGNLVEIDLKAWVDQNVIDESQNENFYQKKLDDELNRIENKFENEGISETLQEGSGFLDNGIGNLVEIEPKTQFDQNVFDESPNENFYQEKLDDDLNKIENKYENEGISERVQEGSSFPDNGIGNLVGIESKTRFDQNGLDESPNENVYQEKLDDELTRTENKFDNEGIHENLPKRSSFPKNGIGNLVEIESKARLDQNVLDESQNENFYQEKLDDEINNIESKFEIEGISETLKEGSNFPNYEIGNLVEIEPKARFDQNVLDESPKENFYQENLDDELNKIESKFENEGINQTLQEGSTFPNYEIGNLVEIESKARLDQNVLDESPKENFYEENLGDELNKIENKFENKRINETSQERSGFPNSGIGNLIEIEPKARFDQKILDESQHESFYRENLYDGLTKIEDKFENEGINENLPEASNFPNNAIDNLIGIEPKAQIDQKILDESRNENFYERKIDVAPNLNEKLIKIENKIENDMITEILEEQSNLPNNGIDQNVLNFTTNGRDDILHETSTFLKNEIKNYENSIEAATNLTGNDTTTEFHRNILEEGVDKAQEELNRTNFDQELIDVDNNQIPCEEMSNYLVLKDGINKDENILDISNSIELVENHAEISQINEIMQETAENLVNIESKNKLDQNNLEEGVDKAETLRQNVLENNQINKIKETLIFLKNEVENYCDEGMVKFDVTTKLDLSEDSHTNDLTIEETSLFLKHEIDNYSGNERRVDFDLSDTQEKISLNSLTHISTFTSTPFANRRPNDSAVILGASDDYSIDYYSGLKTSVDPEEGTDLQFSSNFVRPSNTNDLYSLETWDNFLGRSFDEQENATVDFSDFSQEPHSLLFLECADESGRQTNEVKMTKVLDETYDVGNATVTNDTFIKEIGEENANATFDVSVDKAKDQVETDPWKNAKNNGTASGWFLHPQSTSNDSPIKESAPPATTSTEESYVGFSMDDEIMAAIRNELLTKLPHAQRASSEHQIEESCEEMDSAERNEVFLRYNVYNTPLSPIPEESYDSEMGSGRITPKRINDTSEDEGDSSDWSVQEDNNSSNARTEEIISPRIAESPARCRTDPYRHTPSQDSCCSNDTLFNVEELNTAPNDRLLSEPLFNLTNRLDNPLDSTEDETGDSKYVDCSPERRLTPDQIEPERNGKLPEVPVIRTEHGYILDFLDNERYGEMNTSLDAGEEVSSASDIYLTVSENTFSFGQNVAPLNSPEDRPWKELQASFRDCDEDRYEETNSQKRDINNTLDTTIQVKQDIEPLISTTTLTQNPTDLKDSSSFVPPLGEGEELEDCLISDEDIDQVLREDMESERLSNQKLEENRLDDDKMLEESPISPIDDKTCNSDVYVNLDKTEGEASVDTFDSITPEEEETYIDIENDESAVEDGDKFYVNLEVRSDTRNADLKINDGNIYVNTTKSQGEISSNPADLKDDNIYANLTKTESGESFNTEDSSYSESANGIPVMGYENLRRNNTREEDAIYSKIDSVDDDDTRFDRFGDLFGPLTDIRFSGPGSSSQTMATSFSESCDLGDDQDWDSGSDTRSSSSGEFIWKEGEHEASVKALRAPPQAENINYVTPMENIREEEPPADSHVDNSGGSSSGSEGEDECPEFVPSAWDKYATPTKSALRSPEKTLERSKEEKVGDRRTPKEKKTKGVSFKKQKYHCVYEYPREPESPVLQSYDLWKPAPDYVTLSDWDLDTDAYLPVSSLTNTEIHDTQPLRENSPKNLYHLNAFTDINVDPSVLEEDFFVSSSSKPFDMLTGLTSQFFPGRQFTGDSWTDVTNNTPDSGVEDVTTPATYVDETDGSYGNKNRNDSPLTGVQSLKVLAANAAERSGTRRELGGLRHTRNKLKLDLPPSPSAFTSNRTFSIDTAAEEIVTRQVPTFTTFGKSRFLVQHVDTPPDSGPADKNVSFEALPHKKPESQTLLVDTSRWPEEKRDRQKIESVRGEASLLDSADEDSGIESCTLDRKRFNI